jgi:hypothetical protein
MCLRGRKKALNWDEILDCIHEEDPPTRKGLIARMCEMQRPGSAFESERRKVIYVPKKSQQGELTH